MDQQASRDDRDLRVGGGRPSGVSMDVSSAAPLTLPALALSVVAILVLAAIFVGALAATTGLAQLAVLGLRETRSFYLSLRFDVPTQAKLGALAVTAAYSGIALATTALALWRGRRRWRGLLALEPKDGAWRHHAAIAAMVLVYAALATLALAPPRERRLPLEGPTDPILLALLATNYVLFAPIAEELLFRGWIYTGLRRHLRFGPTVLATSLLFAAIHWEPRHMALVLPLAFALGFIRERTGGIRPTIALHAGYNLVIVTITLLSQ